MALSYIAIPVLLSVIFIVAAIGVVIGVSKK